MADRFTVQAQATPVRTVAKPFAAVARANGPPNGAIDIHGIASHPPRDLLDHDNNVANKPQFSAAILKLVDHSFPIVSKTLSVSERARLKFTNQALHNVGTGILRSVKKAFEPTSLQDFHLGLFQSKLGTPFQRFSGDRSGNEGKLLKSYYNLLRRQGEQHILDDGYVVGPLSRNNPGSLFGDVPLDEQISGTTPSSSSPVSTEIPLTPLPDFATAIPVVVPPVDGVSFTRELTAQDRDAIDTAGQKRQSTPSAGRVTDYLPKELHGFEWMVKHIVDERGCDLFVYSVPVFFEGEPVPTGKVAIQPEEYMKRCLQVWDQLAYLVTGIAETFMLNPTKVEHGRGDLLFTQFLNKFYPRTQVILDALIKDIVNFVPEGLINGQEMASEIMNKMQDLKDARPNVSDPIVIDWSKWLRNLLSHMHTDPYFQEFSKDAAGGYRHNVYREPYDYEKFISALEELDDTNFTLGMCDATHKRNVGKRQHQDLGNQRRQHQPDHHQKAMLKAAVAAPPQATKTTQRNEQSPSTKKTACHTCFMNSCPGAGTPSKKTSEDLCTQPLGKSYTRPGFLVKTDAFKCALSHQSNAVQTYRNVDAAIIAAFIGHDQFNQACVTQEARDHRKKLQLQKSGAANAATKTPHQPAKQVSWKTQAANQTSAQKVHFNTKPEAGKKRSSSNPAKSVKQTAMIAGPPPPGNTGKIFILKQVSGKLADVKPSYKEALDVGIPPIDVLSDTAPKMHYLGSVPSSRTSTVGVDETGEQAQWLKRLSLLSKWKHFHCVPALSQRSPLIQELDELARRNLVSSFIDATLDGTVPVPVPVPVHVPVPVPVPVPVGQQQDMNGSSVPGVATIPKRPNSTVDPSRGIKRPKPNDTIPIHPFTPVIINELHTDTCTLLKEVIPPRASTTLSTTSHCSKSVTTKLYEDGLIWSIKHRVDYSNYHSETKQKLQSHFPSPLQRDLLRFLGWGFGDHESSNPSFRYWHNCCDHITGERMCPGHADRHPTGCKFAKRTKQEGSLATPAQDEFHRTWSGWCKTSTPSYCSIHNDNVFTPLCDSDTDTEDSDSDDEDTDNLDDDPTTSGSDDEADGSSPSVPQSQLSSRDHSENKNDEATEGSESGSRTNDPNSTDDASQLDDSNKQSCKQDHSISTMGIKDLEVIVEEYNMADQLCQKQVNNIDLQRRQKLVSRTLGWTDAERRAVMFMAFKNYESKYGATLSTVTSVMLTSDLDTAGTFSSMYHWANYPTRSELIFEDVDTHHVLPSDIDLDHNKFLLKNVTAASAPADNNMLLQPYVPSTSLLPKLQVPVQLKEFTFQQSVHLAISGKQCAGLESSKLPLVNKTPWLHGQHKDTKESQQRHNRARFHGIRVKMVIVKTTPAREHTVGNKKCFIPSHTATQDVHLKESNELPIEFIPTPGKYHGKVIKKSASRGMTPLPRQFSHTDPRASKILLSQHGKHRDNLFNGMTPEYVEKVKILQKKRSQNSLGPSCVSTHTRTVYDHRHRRFHHEMKAQASATDENDAGCCMSVPYLQSCSELIYKSLHSVDKIRQSKEKLPMPSMLTSKQHQNWVKFQDKEGYSHPDYEKISVMWFPFTFGHLARSLQSTSHQGDCVTCGKLVYNWGYIDSPGHTEDELQECHTHRLSSGETQQAAKIYEHLVAVLAHLRNIGYSKHRQMSMTGARSIYHQLTRANQTVLTYQCRSIVADEIQQVQAHSEAWMKKLDFQTQHIPQIRQALLEAQYRLRFQSHLMSGDAVLRRQHTLKCVRSQGMQYVPQAVLTDPKAVCSVGTYPTGYPHHVGNELHRLLTFIYGMVMDVTNRNYHYQARNIRDHAGDQLLSTLMVQQKHEISRIARNSQRSGSTAASSSHSAYNLQQKHEISRIARNSQRSGSTAASSSHSAYGARDAPTRAVTFSAKPPSTFSTADATRVSHHVMPYGSHKKNRKHNSSRSKSRRGRRKVKQAQTIMSIKHSGKNKSGHHHRALCGVGSCRNLCKGNAKTKSIGQYCIQHTIPSASLCIVGQCLNQQEYCTQKCIYEDYCEQHMYLVEQPPKATAPPGVLQYDPAVRCAQARCLRSCVWCVYWNRWMSHCSGECMRYDHGIKNTKHVSSLHAMQPKPFVPNRNCIIVKPFKVRTNAKNAADYNSGGLTPPSRQDTDQNTQHIDHASIDSTDIIVRINKARIAFSSMHRQQLDNDTAFVTTEVVLNSSAGIPAYAAQYDNLSCKEQQQARHVKTKIGDSQCDFEHEFDDSPDEVNHSSSFILITQRQYKEADDQQMELAMRESHESLRHEQRLRQEIHTQDAMEPEQLAQCFSQQCAVNKDGMSDSAAVGSEMLSTEKQHLTHPTNIRRGNLKRDTSIQYQAHSQQPLVSVELQHVRSLKQENAFVDTSKIAPGDTPFMDKCMQRRIESPGRKTTRVSISTEPTAEATPQETLLWYSGMWSSFCQHMMIQSYASLAPNAALEFDITFKCDERTKQIVLAKEYLKGAISTICRLQLWKSRHTMSLSEAFDGPVATVRTSEGQLYFGPDDQTVHVLEKKFKPLPRLVPTECAVLSGQNPDITLISAMLDTTSIQWTHKVFMTDLLTGKSDVKVVSSGECKSCDFGVTLLRGNLATSYFQVTSPRARNASWNTDIFHGHQTSGVPTSPSRFATPSPLAPDVSQSEFFSPDDAQVFRSVAQSTDQPTLLTTYSPNDVDDGLALPPHTTQEWSDLTMRQRKLALSENVTTWKAGIESTSEINLLESKVHECSADASLSTSMIRRHRHSSFSADQLGTETTQSAYDKEQTLNDVNFVQSHDTDDGEDSLYWKPSSFATNKQLSTAMSRMNIADHRSSIGNDGSQSDVEQFDNWNVKDFDLSMATRSKVTSKQAQISGKSPSSPVSDHIEETMDPELSKLPYPAGMTVMGTTRLQGKQVALLRRQSLQSKPKRTRFPSTPSPVSMFHSRQEAASAAEHNVQCQPSVASVPMSIGSSPKTPPRTRIDVTYATTSPARSSHLESDTTLTPTSTMDISRIEHGLPGCCPQFDILGSIRYPHCHISTPHIQQTDSQSMGSLETTEHTVRSDLARQPMDDYVVSDEQAVLTPASIDENTPSPTAAPVTRSVSSTPDKLYGPHWTLVRTHDPIDQNDLDMVSVQNSKSSPPSPSTVQESCCLLGSAASVERQSKQIACTSSEVVPSQKMADILLRPLTVSTAQFKQQCEHITNAAQHIDVPDWAWQHMPDTHLPDALYDNHFMMNDDGATDGCTKLFGDCVAVRKCTEETLFQGSHNGWEPVQYFGDIAMSMLTIDMEWLFLKHTNFLIHEGINHRLMPTLKLVKSMPAGSFFTLGNGGRHYFFVNDPEGPHIIPSGEIGKFDHEYLYVRCYIHRRKDVVAILKEYGETPESEAMIKALVLDNDTTAPLCAIGEGYLDELDQDLQNILHWSNDRTITDNNDEELSIIAEDNTEHSQGNDDVSVRLCKSLLPATVHSHEDTAKLNEDQHQHKLTPSLSARTSRDDSPILFHSADRALVPTSEEFMTTEAGDEVLISVNGQPVEASKAPGSSDAASSIFDGHQTKINEPNVLLDSTLNEHERIPYMQIPITLETQGTVWSPPQQGDFDILREVPDRATEYIEQFRNDPIRQQYYEKAPPKVRAAMDKAITSITKSGKIIAQHWEKYPPGSITPMPDLWERRPRKPVRTELPLSSASAKELQYNLTEVRQDISRRHGPKVDAPEAHKILLKMFKVQHDNEEEKEEIQELAHEDMDRVNIQLTDNALEHSKETSKSMGSLPGNGSTPPSHVPSTTSRSQQPSLHMATLEVPATSVDVHDLTQDIFHQLQILDYMSTPEMVVDPHSPTETWDSSGTKVDCRLLADEHACSSTEILQEQIQPMLKPGTGSDNITVFAISVGPLVLTNYINESRTLPDISLVGYTSESSDPLPVNCALKSTPNTHHFGTLEEFLEKGYDNMFGDDIDLLDITGPTGTLESLSPDHAAFLHEVMSKLDVIIDYLRPMVVKFSLPDLTPLHQQNRSVDAKPIAKDSPSKEAHTQKEQQRKVQIEQLSLQQQLIYMQETMLFMVGDFNLGYRVHKRTALSQTYGDSIGDQRTYFVMFKARSCAFNSCRCNVDDVPWVTKPKQCTQHIWFRWPRIFENAIQDSLSPPAEVGSYTWQLKSKLQLSSTSKETKGKPIVAGTITSPKGITAPVWSTFGPIHTLVNGIMPVILDGGLPRHMMPVEAFRGLHLPNLLISHLMSQPYMVQQQVLSSTEGIISNINLYRTSLLPLLEKLKAYDGKTALQFQQKLQQARDSNSDACKLASFQLQQQLQQAQDEIDAESEGCTDQDISAATVQGSTITEATATDKLKHDGTTLTPLKHCGCKGKWGRCCDNIDLYPRSENSTDLVENDDTDSATPQSSNSISPPSTSPASTSPASSDVNTTIPGGNVLLRPLQLQIGENITSNRITTIALPETGQQSSSLIRLVMDVPLYIPSYVAGSEYVMENHTVSELWFAMQCERLAADVSSPYHEQHRCALATATQRLLERQETAGLQGSADPEGIRVVPEAVYYFPGGEVVYLGMPTLLTSEHLGVLDDDVFVPSHAQDGRPMVYQGFNAPWAIDNIKIVRAGASQLERHSPTLVTKHALTRSEHSAFFKQLAFTSPIVIPHATWPACYHTRSDFLQISPQWIMDTSHYANPASFSEVSSATNSNCKIVTASHGTLRLASTSQAALRQNSVIIRALLRNFENTKHSRLVPTSDAIESTNPPSASANTPSETAKCALQQHQPFTGSLDFSGEQQEQTKQAAMLNQSKSADIKQCAFRLSSAAPDTTLDIYHRLWGHKNFWVIAKMYKERYPNRPLSMKHHPCTDCWRAKLIRLQKSKWMSRPKHKLGFWSFDVCDLNDGTYAFLFKDGACCVVAGRLESHVDDATTIAVLEAVIAETTRYGMTFLHVSADRGQLHTNAVKEYLTRRGISSEFTPGYESSANSIAEHTNHVIVQTMRVLLIGANLKGNFASSALRHAIMITNNTDSVKLEKMRIINKHISTTPWKEMARLVQLEGRTSYCAQDELLQLHRFGACAWLLKVANEGGDKKAAVSRPTVYLGRASDTKDASLCYDPATKHMLCVRHIATDDLNIGLTLNKDHIQLLGKFWNVRQDISVPDTDNDFTTFMHSKADGTTGTVTLQPLAALQHRLYDSAKGFSSEIISESMWKHSEPPSDPFTNLDHVPSLEGHSDPTPPAIQEVHFIDVRENDILLTNTAVCDSSKARSMYMVVRARKANGLTLAQARKLLYTDSKGNTKKYTLQDVRYDIKHSRLNIQRADDTAHDPILSNILTKALQMSPATNITEPTPNRFWTAPGSEPKSLDKIDVLQEPCRLLWDAARFKEEADQTSSRSYDMVPSCATGPFPSPREVVVLKVKELARDEHGDPVLDKFKIRSAQNGAASVEGVNHCRHDAKTLSLVSYKTLLAVAMLHGLMIENADVTAAYLNAPNHYPCFSTPADKLFRLYDKHDKMYVKYHRRAVYGAVPSGALFWSHIDRIIISLGFVRLESMDCVYRFVKKCDDSAKSTDTNKNEDSSSYVLIIGLYVDDLVLLHNNSSLSKWFKDSMEAAGLSFTWMGELTHFLGHSVKRDYKQDQLHISLATYIAESAELFSATKYAKKGFPTGSEINKDQCPAEDDLKTKAYMRAQPFKKVVGRLNWIVHVCFPSLLYPLRRLQAIDSNPAPMHMKIALELLGYAYNNKELGLTFHGPNSPFWTEKWYDDSAPNMYIPGNQDQLVMHFDSTHTVVETDGEFPEVCVVATLAGACISAVSEKVRTTTRSTAESEGCAAYRCSSVAIAIRKALDELCVYQGPTICYGDNQACLTLARAPFTSTKTKIWSPKPWVYMRLKHVQEMSLSKILDFAYCPTDSNVADFATKLLTDRKHKSFENQLTGQPPIYVPGTQILTRHLASLQKRSRQEYLDNQKAVHDREVAKQVPAVEEAPTQVTLANTLAHDTAVLTPVLINTASFRVVGTGSTTIVWASSTRWSQHSHSMRNEGELWFTGNRQPGSSLGIPKYKDQLRSNNTPPLKKAAMAETTASPPSLASVNNRQTTKADWAHRNPRLGSSKEATRTIARHFELDLKLKSPWISCADYRSDTAPVA